MQQQLNTHWQLCCWNLSEELLLLAVSYSSIGNLVHVGHTQTPAQWCGAERPLGCVPK